MSISLYDHQISAIQKMKNGCILCGGVGSGKSRTSLAYIHLLYGGKIDPFVKMQTPHDIYIITTARKRDTKEWEEELHPFLMSTDSECNTYNNKITIDSWNNIKKYVEVSDAFFIFDEQRVVGKGAWAKTFIKITRKNKWVLLSATPGDTWQDYIPVFIANGFYKNRREFETQHIVYSRYSKYPKVERYENLGRLLRLRNSILVDMDFDRPTVSHHEDVIVPYDIYAYKDIVRKRWNYKTDKPITNATQFCYTLREEVNTAPERSQVVLDIVADKKRVIIFYNFDYELFLLRGLDYQVDDEKPEIAEWNGYKHQPIPDSKYWVYLVQYNAGSEAWNCIDTDTIIFFSQTYSYRTMEQASGRIDRLNTPFKDLYFYHLKSKAPIDIAISRALKNKKKFNERKFFES